MPADSTAKTGGNHRTSAVAADVFVSYSREDKDVVLTIAEELRREGVSVWIDQGSIDGATIWGEEIVHALEAAKVMLLMISGRSVDSANVLKEVMLASEHKDRILPVHLEPTRIPAALKYPLAGIQHIEFYEGDRHSNIKSILRSLERLGCAVRKEPPVAVGGDPTAHPSAKRSPVPDNGIAVLPFENSSPDPDADYFSAGLTDELIASLSKVAGLPVVSRLTSMQYKGTIKDAPTIGSELQARHVVTGSVRKFMDNLRITAQLTDAKTNMQMWAETYKGTLEDIFDIQERVANEIAEALKLKLTLNEKVVLGKRPTLNPEAFDLYLRGKVYLYKFTKANIEFAIQVFEKALQLDSRYAAAYAACSEAYGQLSLLYGKKEEYYERALELGLKALMYDNTLPEAYAALGLAYFCKKNFEDGLSSSQRAIELDKENFLAYWILGRIYHSTGEPRQAIPYYQRVVELKPDFYTAMADLQMAYLASGDLEGAQETQKWLIAFFPGYLWDHPDDARAHVFHAHALSRAGQLEEARAAGTKAEELAPNDALILYNLTCLHSLTGDVERAIGLLERTFAAGFQFYDWIKHDTDLESLRKHPRYAELMKDR